MPNRLKDALHELNIDGLGPSAEHALTSAFRTVESLGLADFAHASRVCGLSIESVQRLALEVMATQAPPLTPALDAHRARELVDAVLPTGLRELDWLLGGGLATGEVTELAGGPCSCKTQLCLLASLPRWCCRAAPASYTSTRAAHSDPSAFTSTFDFSTPPPSPMAKAAAPSLRACATCDSWLPLGCRLLFELERLDAELEDAASATTGSGGDATVPSPRRAADEEEDDDDWLRRLRLLVVDSVFTAMLAEHSGETRSAAGAQQARLQQLLRRLATRHRLAVLLTNAPSMGGGAAGAEPSTAFGGHAWNHLADTRVLLTRDGPAGAAVAHVVKCPHSIRRLVQSTDGAVRITCQPHGGIIGERCPGSPNYHLARH